MPHHSIDLRHLLPREVDIGSPCGIGDFRQEKGKGNFGQYRACEPNDPEIKKLMKIGGRDAQDEALANPKYHDADTDDSAFCHCRGIAGRNEN